MNTIKFSFQNIFLKDTNTLKSQNNNEICNNLMRILLLF